MYLKALEIQGFKSFPDKIYLPFDEKITAVVGPNGSGKSNISDAIRWVVGEQSARMLRGGKMEDVIFGGTATRKQTSYAQVSLIMDNSQGLFPLEETEVMVTRKYYRSSKKSEYFINKQQSLLQDVHSLFLGTGLGREGYAIIGQGRIDEILSVKSNQRREVFEEAAGISKYRHQKEESERKLARAEENMLRIEDKISELELQVKPLEKQSEKAKKFLVLRDQLRGLEISLWLEQLAEIQTKQGQLEQDYQLATEEKNTATETLAQLYQEIEAMTEELGLKSVEEDGLRKELSQQEQRLSEQETQITVLHTNISNNESNAKRLEESLEQKQGRKLHLSKQIGQQQEKSRELAENLGQLSREQELKMAEVLTLGQELQEKNQLLSNLRQGQQVESRSLSEVKAQLSALSSSTQAIFDQDEVLRRELGEIQGKLQEEQAGLQALETERQTAEEGRIAAANSVAGYGLRVEGREEKLSVLQQQGEQLGRSIHAGESKIKLLSEMEQMYEGFSHAVKKVMQEVSRGGLQHIHGPVAELIDVPRQFTVAVETALGSAMNHLVVETTQDGKRVIDFLKRQKAGRATILPLDSIQPGYLNQKDQLQQEPGFVGIGNELVGYDKRYTRVVSNLLGRTVVMENLDYATVTAKKFGFKLRIVTLDGQVMNAGGSMTGGAENRSAGILSRKDELVQQKEKNQVEKAQLQALQGEQDSLRATLSGDKYQLELAQGERRQWEDALLQVQGKREGCLGRITSLQEQVEQGQEKLSQLSQKGEEVESFSQEAQRNILRQEAKVKDLEQAEGEAILAQSALQEQWQEANEAARQLTARLQGIQVEERALADAQQMIQSLLQEVDTELGSESNLMENFSAENQGYSVEISRMTAENEHRREKILTLQNQISVCHQSRMALEGNRVQKDRESREKNQDLRSLERAVTVLEESKNAGVKEETLVLNKLWDTYELGHQAALQQKQPLESIAVAQKKVADIKREITNLGNVNVNAIEEFQRVNERYCYFVEQGADVLKAKGELEKIIQEIVAEMETIFLREFQKINETFGEVFVALFGGGRAEVVLDEPEDVLGSGIEIKAQPPGKALKVISLLSGGEKAFIAVALYFAILQIRPTPFVVMDEIDAALDDGNVERLVGYLKTIIDKTQFIIITHRRGSMEAADVLYGITMQEKGVSRMLRLSLNEVEKTLNMTVE